MSRKINAFHSVINNPLNMHNFEVQIPGFNYAIVVQSTQFPSEKMRTVVLYTYGEEVRYPTLPQNDGNWPIQVPDSDTGVIRESLDSLKAEMYDQTSGLLTPPDMYDIEVRARDLENTVIFKTIMHMAWIEGRDSVNLANNDPTKPWMWDYRFRYNWLEDKD